VAVLELNTDAMFFHVLCEIYHAISTRIYPAIERGWIYCALDGIEGGKTHEIRDVRL
jgi:hypothetical protein